MATIKRVHTFDGHGQIEATTTRYSAWPEILVVSWILFCLGLVFSHPTTQVDIDMAPKADAAPASLPQDARTLAALAVYHQATADDWLQRAAIAQAALNAQAGGMLLAVPDTTHPDAIAWQNALDAVDAVASGDYVLPPPCARATAVVPLPRDEQWSGSQCVIRDLEFVETPR